MFSYVFAKTDTLETLEGKIRTFVRQYPQLVCGIYIKPSWVNGSISINGDAVFPAASLIKLPIAVALLKKIDKKEILWGKTLVLLKKHCAQGAGILRNRKVGTRISVKETFKLMLIVSDNTATNMIIDLLGGIQVVNQEIRNLGLKNTRLVNYLGDFAGTNKTSPHDMVEILEKSLEGEILTSGSRKLLRENLLRANNKSLIKKGLSKFTKFAHKTGTIGICVGDAGIIYLLWGKKIGIAVIVRRPFNSLQGQRVINGISELVYENLK